MERPSRSPTSTQTTSTSSACSTCHRPAVDRTIRQANVFHLDMQGKATSSLVVAERRRDPRGARDRRAGARASQRGTVPRRRGGARRNTFDAGDLELIGEFLRDDVHWRSPWGAGPSSRDEVVQQFHAFKESTGGTMALALATCSPTTRTRCRSCGSPPTGPTGPTSTWTCREANVFHLDSDGRAYEFWGVADDQAAINSFWTD